MIREQHLQVVSNSSVKSKAKADKKVTLRDGDHYQKVRTRLLSLLQTTLETSELMELFFNVLQEQLGVSHLSYSNPQQGLQFDCGKKAQHTASYCLSNNEQELGEITVSRRQAFIENELLVLEYLIGPLVLPLRNCIMYHQAILSAHTDPLTGLGSRSALVNTLEREFGIARRLQWPLSLVVIDIDWFKRINDTYGHSMGDVVLRKVADAVRSCLRTTDQCFRYGGEEFVVVLSKTDAQQASEISERIRQAVASLLIVRDSSTITTSVSIGVAEAGPEDDSISLFDQADAALYAAKNAGRNQVMIAE